MTTDTAIATDKTSKANRPRLFDFCKHQQRRIALKIMYLGWDFDGLASQDNSTNTIEHHVFAALQQAKLIQDRPSCEYTRCGRTDKGVSALCQVLALNVRSMLPAGHPEAFPFDNASNSDSADATAADPAAFDQDKDELPYVRILNRLLPEEIRVLQWCPVPRSFNARFDCSSRTYKYFFPGARYNIAAMQEAARMLVGTHDFRNFCKFDASKNIDNYERTILEASITRVSRDEAELSSGAFGDWQGDVYAFTVTGTAFLWHQVRMMMSILYLVGEGKEKPEIVQWLLDVGKVPIRPQFVLASEVPLVLWECAYDGSKNCGFKPAFHGLLGEHLRLLELMKSKWESIMAKASILRGAFSNVLTAGHASMVVVPHRYLDKNACTEPSKMLKTFEQVTTQEIESSGVKVNLTGKYIPLAERSVCGNASMEERNAKYRARRELKRKLEESGKEPERP